MWSRFYGKRWICKGFGHQLAIVRIMEVGWRVSKSRSAQHPSNQLRRNSDLV